MSCGGSQECGPGGWDGPGFGHGGRLKPVVFGTAALLLDGPADAGQIVERAASAAEGAFEVSQDVVQQAIEILSDRGLVTVEDRVATLTEHGTEFLSRRGVTSKTAHAMLGRAGRFADVIKIRSGLKEVAGMARTIMWSGTDGQKAKLVEVRRNLATAVADAKRALHGALAEG